MSDGGGSDDSVSHSGTSDSWVSVSNYYIWVKMLIYNTRLRPSLLPSPLCRGHTRAWYTRAEALRQRQETLLAEKAGQEEVQNDQEMNDSGSGVDSDLEYDDLLDWRKKRT